jgi:hypothetical protein
MARHTSGALCGERAKVPVVEAMKAQNVVRAECYGEIDDVVGAKVGVDEILLTFKKATKLDESKKAANTPHAEQSPTTIKPRQFDQYVDP